MKRRFSLAIVAAAVVTLVCALPGHYALHGDRNDAPKESSAKDKSKNAWTLEEAQGRLELDPHDPYLQYVALQLARRENSLDSVAQSIEMRIDARAQAERMGRREQVDLVSTVTGALAVQERLQLD